MPATANFVVVETYEGVVTSMSARPKQASSSTGPSSQTAPQSRSRTCSASSGSSASSGAKPSAKLGWMRKLWRKVRGTPKTAAERQAAKAAKLAKKQAKLAAKQVKVASKRTGRVSPMSHLHDVKVDDDEELDGLAAAKLRALQLQAEAATSVKQRQRALFQAWSNVTDDDNDGDDGDEGDGEDGAHVAMARLTASQLEAMQAMQAAASAAAAYQAGRRGSSMTHNSTSSTFMTGQTSGAYSGISHGLSHGGRRTGSITAAMTAALASGRAGAGGVAREAPYPPASFFGIEPLPAGKDVVTKPISIRLSGTRVRTCSRDCYCSHCFDLPVEQEL